METEPEHDAHQVRPQSADPGPYRFFWADVIRKECPECGWATAVGFDHPADPGAQTREPTSCTGCMAREIEHGIKAEAEARNTYALPDVPVPAARAPEVTEITQPEPDELELSA